MRKNIESIGEEKLKNILLRYYVEKFNENSTMENQNWRKLLFFSIEGRDNTWYFELEGSGPKGYGICFPVIGGFTITLYDAEGVSFRNMHTKQGIIFLPKENEDRRN
ncbi:MAG TPA: hypothetical protein PKN54_04845 [Candidatus Cloacimonas acidaminovorans]|nr:hypothetical protein [Candidatus Cloacimonas acidaminovorans]